MKIKISIIIIILFLISGIIKASVIDTTAAKNIARNFIYEKINIDEKVNYSAINLQCITEEKENNLPIFYIYNIKNRPGFVIVSAEDVTIPVLGYSYEYDYDLTEQLPPAFVEWINHYKKQINYIRQNNIVATKSVKQLWTKYSSIPVFQKATRQLNDVSPLLTTTWSQGTYYNQLCPADGGGPDGHVVTGCVATAMAQLIKYWNYPDYGSGSHSYSHWNYGLQSADFANTYYNWSAMPNSLSNYNTPVATLMYHCGVSVNMDYGPSNSGAYSTTAALALKNFFDYSYTLYLASKNNYVDTVWRDMIKSELDLGHPLFYVGNPSSGGGHAWVCDGYQGIDYFHMNWGWGGSYNGYFYLNDLTPGSYDFSYNQKAIINCYPDCQNPQCNGVTTVTDVAGTFDDGLSGSNYSNCSDCEYLIQPTGATSIYIEFNNFSTIEGEDSLYVYDGSDDTAPLLYALTGDTIPNSFISSTGSVYFHFVSDNFRTAPGWQVTYTTAFDDVGVTHIDYLEDKTCGVVQDTIQVQVKNFGVNTQTNVPVVVDVNTPTGPLTFNAVLPGPISRNETQTLYVGTINSVTPGVYSYTAYTTLQSDSIIHSNDTTYQDVLTKIPFTIPHAEIFDDLHGQSGDWVDRNWTALPDYEVSGTDTNYFMRGWVDQWMSMFLILDNNIENITANTNLLFDYRVLDAGGAWPPTDSLVLSSNEKFNIVVSTDCGITFDTIFTIDSLNHINSADFATKEVSLGTYAGNDIIIGFVTQWDARVAIVDIDNVFIIDDITNNNISANQTVCGNNLPNPLIGSLPAGGIGGYSYLWEESPDSSTWTAATGINNLQNYSPPVLSVTTFYRRIVNDTLIYSDTSNITTLTHFTNPTVNIQGDTIACGSTILDEGVGNSGDSYYWSTGDTTQTIIVNTSGNYSLTVTDGNGCFDTDTVAITIFDLPIAPDSVNVLNPSLCLGEYTNLVYYGGSGTIYAWYTDSCGGISVGTGNNISVSPTVTTTYYGRWENSCGNSACKQVQIIVNAVPTADFSYVDNGNLTVDFTSLATNATIWNWNFGDGNTSTQTNPSHTYASGGAHNVTLEVDNAFGCGPVSITKVVDVIVSVFDNANTDFVNIYPNPTTGILHIENYIDSNTTIKILDLTGQEIMKCNLNKIIDLSNLNNGLYILQLESKQSTFVSKIIINK